MKGFNSAMLFQHEVLSFFFFLLQWNEVPSAVEFLRKILWKCNQPETEMIYLYDFIQNSKSQEKVSQSSLIRILVRKDLKETKGRYFVCTYMSVWVYC